MKSKAPARHVGSHTCADCGKRSYDSRRDAKTAMKRWGDSQGMSAYACPSGDGWHFGHRPSALTRGLIGRGEIA